MTKPVEAGQLFINRELSWLAFNERVLEEAADPTTPLLERARFVAIAASNLDEFFMVRVAALRHAVDDGETAPDLSGLTPLQQIDAVRTRARAFIDSMYAVTRDQLLPALAGQGIRIVPFEEVDSRRQAALGSFFRDAVLPVLTPLAIDVSRPFPLLSSLSVNLVVRLAPGEGEPEERLAVVQVPTGLRRLVPLPGESGPVFVFLEDIIRAHLSQLFVGQQLLETSVVRLARDAELELDDEGGRTHVELVEREVRRRRRGEVMRLEIEDSSSAVMRAILARQLDVEREDVYTMPGPLDLRVLMRVAELDGYEALKYPPVQPVSVLEEDEGADLLAVLDSRDVVLHHPYDSFDPVVALITQAADDPEVLAIKQTLYRASADSLVIAALQRAAERNKQVTVLVEVTARFDEERNILWARTLEEAGAHVIYGVRGLKTHAKVCLIVRRTPQGLRRYVHLGTGNYNERTARVYTDFGLMTTSEPIAEDATAFFSAITGYSDPPKLKKLVMAPTGLRRRFLQLIDRERRRAEAGQPAEILAQMNSLIDERIIEALYAASRAGVTIRLAVRGICALRPGVPGHSENIEVISIVDRFLEHARIYYFLNGGDEQVYLASADWMTRNLDRRIELMFPVQHQDARARVLLALRAMFRDTVKARRLAPDGVYRRVEASEGAEPFRVQEYLQEEAARRSRLARKGAGVVFKPER